MSMSPRSGHIFVISMTAVGLMQSPMAALQPLDPTTDPNSYEIYAVVVPPAWAGLSRRASGGISGTMLSLQQETEGPWRPCRPSVRTPDPEWELVENNFDQENTRVRLLQPVLPLGIPYRLIPRAEIEADDAR